MKTTKQFYVVVNDDFKHGTIIDNKESLKSLKEPITFQAFPEHLRQQMQLVLEQEEKRLKKMH